MNSQQGELAEAVRQLAQLEATLARQQQLVNELTEQEIEIHRRQQQAVYRRNALQSSVSGLRSYVIDLRDKSEDTT